MSLADNKKNVFTTIGSYTSLNQEGNRPKQTNLYPSINNKKEPIPFMLDVLKTVAGTEALKELMGGMVTELVDKAEPKLKTALKKQFTQSNSNEVLPMGGVTMPVKNIDIKGKFKVSTSSTEGSLLYDGSKPNFDWYARQAIVNAGTEVQYLEGNMGINYNTSTDSFLIKPLTSSTNIGTYFGTYIDNAQILNKKEVVSSVMNGIYGTLTAKQKKTVDQTYEELQVQMLLEQLLAGDDSFVISQENYDDLLQKAHQMTNGVVYYDMGCGMMAAELSFDSLYDSMNSIEGSTDPFFVGNVLDSTINQSATGSTAENNRQTIKDNFFQRIIRLFTVMILEAITTAPQVRVLMGMSSAFQNNGDTQITIPKEDLKKNKVLCNCMAKETTSIIGEFIFALVAVYLAKLLKPIIKKVLKEKINQFIKIMKSLTGANKLNI